MTTLNPPTVWAVPDQIRSIYAHAREAPSDRTLFVSGQFGIAPDGRMGADFAEQLGQAMANVEALLAAAGMTLADVRKATFILTRTDNLCVLEQTRQDRWASNAPAAVTVLVAAALAHRDALVEIEVTAVEQTLTGGRGSKLGNQSARMLPRIVQWARSLTAVPYRSMTRLDEQGVWVLHDLGLERSDVRSPAERPDEVRRGLSFQ